jgi:hypothetical protein
VSAPGRIWFQYYGDPELNTDDTTWCVDNIFEHDVEWAGRFGHSWPKTMAGPILMSDPIPTMMHCPF